MAGNKDTGAFVTVTMQKQWLFPPWSYCHTQWSHLSHEGNGLSLLGNNAQMLTWLMWLQPLNTCENQSLHQFWTGRLFWVLHLGFLMLHRGFLAGLPIQQLCPNISCPVWNGSQDAFIATSAVQSMWPTPLYKLVLGTHLSAVPTRKFQS